MKFLVDAQLPKKLSKFLLSKGIDSIHTLELPKRNRTPDSEIIILCENENRIIITKDSDFYESKILKNIPKKLVVVLTGNIDNDVLINLFDNYISRIIDLLNDYDIVEIDQNSIKAK